MTKKFRTILSILCTLALLLACMTAAFAEDPQPETPEEPANTEEVITEDINPDALLGAETPEEPEEAPANEEEPKEEPQEEQGEEGQEEVPEELPEEKPEETPEENVPEQNEPAPEPEEEPASDEAEQNVTAADPADDEQDQGSEEAIHPDTDTAPEETPAENLQEIVSDPMTIQDAVNQAEETEEPAEEETTTSEGEAENTLEDETVPEEAETPEAEEETTQEDETAMDETNTEDTAPADEPEPAAEEQNNEEESAAPETEDTPAEEEPAAEDTTTEDEKAEESEEIILNLNGRTVCRGKVSKDTPFTVKSSDDYSRTIVFTLTVPTEDIISVYLDDKQIELTKTENPDPDSTDILYTFEKQLDQTKVFEFTLKTESTEEVSFKLKIAKKEAPTQDTPDDLSEEDNNQEENEETNEETPADENTVEEPVDEETIAEEPAEEKSVESVLEEKPAEELFEESAVEEERDISADNAVQEDTAEEKESEKEIEAEDSLNEEEQIRIDKSETENEAVANNKTKQEEKPVEIPDDQTMLAMGYYKVQVLRENGTSLVATIETYEETEHLPFGSALWVKPTEDNKYAEVYSQTDDTIRYVKWDDLLIVLQKEKEQTEAADENGDSDTDEQQEDVQEEKVTADDEALDEQEKDESTEELADEEAEEPLARSLRISSTLTSMGGFIDYGTPITITVELVDFKEDDEYTCKWQYSVDGVNFVDIENADGLTYTYPLSAENYNNTWKFIISLSDSE